MGFAFDFCLRKANRAVLSVFISGTKRSSVVSGTSGFALFPFPDDGQIKF